VPSFRFFAPAKCAGKFALAILLPALGGSAAEPPGDLRDIAPPVEMPEDVCWPWYAAFGSGGIIMLASAGYLVRRRRAAVRAAQARVTTPPPPPSQAALEALAALDAGLPYKLYYTRLAEIVRTYIAGRFDVDAPDATASELLRMLFRLRRLPGEHQALLRSLFAEADLVKFADWVPNHDAPSRALDSVRRFIKETGDAL
jgi:hypothetical protein